MPQTRGSGLRTRRFGAAVVAAALASVAIPATGQAQDTTGSLPEATGNGSIDNAIGLLPEEIVIGGPGLAGGSEVLRDTGSGVIPDAALSVGQVAGSVAPLGSLGVDGGSAAASVASSGSLPGSVYANPVGSIGSGTIGIGSLVISEVAIGGLALQAAAVYVNVLAERQEAGTLSPDELGFFNGVVVGSSRAGGLLEDAARATGTALPGSLAGSIDAVQRSALENPVEAQDRIRADAAARAEAEAAGEDAAEDTVEDTAEDGAPDAETAGTARDDDELGDSPDTGGARAGTDALAGTGDGMPALSAVTATPTATPTPAPTAAPATLAVTGTNTAGVAGLAIASVLLGGFLLAASRRRS